MKAEKPSRTMRATVKAASSSRIPGAEGRGSRSFTTTPRAPGLNVTTDAGRHSTGGRLANSGSQRSGQGASSSGMNPGTGYNPKTGVSPSSPSRSMRPQPPVLTDQRTSEGAQRLISRPPSPFDNPYSAVNVPAPANPGERFSGDNATEGRTRWLRSSSASIHSGTSLTKEEMAAIGYEPGDTKSTESIISGFPTKGNSRQSGMPGTNSPRKASLNLLRQKGGR